MQNKINKKYQNPFHFRDFFKKMTYDSRHFNIEERKKKKVEKRKKEKPDYITIGILHISHKQNAKLCILYIYYFIFISYIIFIIYFGYDKLGPWTLTYLLYLETENFLNNILRLLGIKHRKLYSLSLSRR